MSAPPLEILIPTCDRPAALALTLSCLCFQDSSDFNVIVADQGDADLSACPEVQSVIRLLALRGIAVRMLSNRPRRGIAQQRQFLLDAAQAAEIIFLDDDILLEPWLIQTISAARASAGCGFVGSAVIGLGYRNDVRRHEQAIEIWDGPVLPERVDPGTPQWQRHRLHNAANVLHVQEDSNAVPGELAALQGCVGRRLRAV